MFLAMYTRIGEDSCDEIRINITADSIKFFDIESGETVLEMTEVGEVRFTTAQYRGSELVEDSGVIDDYLDKYKINREDGDAV